MQTVPSKNTQRLRETTENHLIDIGPGLLLYGRKAVLREWDPTTPRVTDKMQEILQGLSDTASKS